MVFTRKANGWVLGGALLLAAGLTACAPTTQMPQITDQAAAEEARKQREFAIRERMRMEQRLQAVAWRVRLASAELCADAVRAGSGMQTMVQEDGQPEFRPVLASLYGIQEQATILQTIPGGPADKAGLKPGDVLVALNGEAVPKGKDGNKFLSDKIGATTGAVDLKAKRGADEAAVQLQPERICAFPAQLKTDDRVNAFADGRGIYVTTGLMRFVATDDELALIVGHELAHNTMDHIAKQRGNRIAGRFVGAVLDAFLGGTGVFTQIGEEAAGGAYSQDFEAEADYVGVYYAARAGYDVKGAADLWRRMATANPAAIHLAGSTHPSTAKRFLAIEAAADEVVKKAAGGEPLAPTVKAPE